MTPGGIVMVTSGFPRVSETFALNELLALDRQGLLGPVFATKPGDSSLLQPGAADLLDRVEVLPPGNSARQAAALLVGLRGRRVGGFHGYFAHSPAAVAAHAACRTGARYGFSAHALDVRKVAPVELAARLQGASGVVACNADVAAPLRSAGSRLHVVPHGVDLDRFTPRPTSRGSELQLLVVARLVEKKGLPVLVEAVARLRSPVRLRVVGAGPQRASLEAAVAAAGIADRVELPGPVTHAELPGCYAASDVVVVPSVVDGGGDRDGLPNVVLEAMASGLPVVASDVGAIATAVTHGETGLLVRPGDPDALVAALTRLAESKELRGALGSAGRRRVEGYFGLDACTSRLGRVLAGIYG
jgi:glycosyltransferase involved in cell wall biosynthesis